MELIIRLRALGKRLTWTITEVTWRMGTVGGFMERVEHPAWYKSSCLKLRFLKQDAGVSLSLNL